MTAMRKSRLIMALALVTLSAAIKVEAQQSPAQRVETAFKNYVAAWKGKDVAALRKLIADDYMVMTPSAELSTKDKELASVQSDPPYDEMSVEEIHTRRFGNSAIATGLISASGTDTKGTSFNYEGRFLAVLVKRRGAWQLVATQSGPVRR